ncbi:MAG: dihydrofolate reductase family protein [Ferruginibacter sp.]
MKVVLVFVSTLDGKITKWGNPHVKDWSSQNDQAYYQKIWTDARLVVMGSSTFNAEQFSPSSNHLLVVMTKQFSSYKELNIPGQLEFTGKSPIELTGQFKKEGYETMVVVGGAHIATSFFKEQLIDELWLTIEPKIFGTGGSFVIEENLDIDLKLISFEKVNEQGTLITKYAVIKKG